MWKANKLNTKVIIRSCLGIGGLLAMTLAACAPKPEKREFAPAQTKFDTQKTDTDLGLNAKVETQTISMEHLSWNSEMDSSRFLSTAERLIRLGDTWHNGALSAVGEKWAASFEGSPSVTTSVLFSESPYASAVVGETREDTLAYLDGLTAMIKSDRKKVVSLLERGRVEFPWPKSFVGATAMIATVERFLHWWISGLGTEKIDQLILGEIRVGAQAEFNLQTVKINTHVQRIRQSQTLTQALKAVNAFVADFKIDLDPSARTELKSAELIGLDLDHLTTAQQALTLIYRCA